MALAHALTRMIARPDLRASYARRALQRARSWPTAAEVADRYLACYQGRDAATCRPSDSLTSGTIPLTTAWAHHVDGLSHCPLPQPLQLPTDASVLVIAPHPDDETLACGGTIAKLRQRDCIVRVVFLTDGALGDPEHHFDTDIKAARYQEALAALEILDVTETVQLDRADGGLSADESLALRLHHLFQTFSPELVLIPPLLDQHRDHVAASLASLEAWRLSGLRPRVAMWELWQPLPVNRVVDITDVFELRHRASQAYRIPLHYCDYSASAAALARYRSLYLAAADYAEGFLELDPKTVDVELDRLLALRLDIEPSTAAPPAPP
jgi:LmbE family N-acetylglucosaminyl deacetylase